MPQLLAQRPSRLSLVVRRLAIPWKTRMQRSSLLVATLLILLAAGCDPVGVMRLRQTLNPVPAPSCVASAIADSPHATLIQVASGESGLHYVVLQDPTDPGVSRHAEVVSEAPSDTGQVVTVRFIWIGTTQSRSAEEQALMVRLATPLLEDIRRACAPNAPSAVACTLSGTGPGGTCRIT